MVLNLPALDGEAWAGLMMAGGAAQGGGASEMGGVALPGDVTLRTPAVTLAGQQWHDIDATLEQGAKGSSNVSITGREIRGTLAMTQNAAWRVALDYLYYNPEWQNGGDSSAARQQQASKIDFSRWPALQPSCAECWLRGQKFGRIQAQVAPKGDTLALTNGLVDTGSVRSHIDNVAAYDCDDAEQAEDCRTRTFNLDFALRMDDSDRSARTWPVLIEETGIECGGKQVRREHRFTLDPKTWTYAYPDALQREGCR